MASHRQFLDLIRHAFADDREAFRAQALDMRKQSPALYDRLIALCPPATQGRRLDRLPFRAPALDPELKGLLEALSPTHTLEDLIVSAPLRRGLERVVEEQRGGDVLRENGLSPSARLLLLGPPGTGKTMTAGALALSLGLPLFRIAEGMLQQWLGQTSQNIARVFAEMRARRGVYLLDEIDGLGRDREGSDDVGEARRILCTLLHHLEGDLGGSLIVATSNNAWDLDRALFRRFDVTLTYKKPGEEEIRALLAHILAPWPSDIDLDEALMAELRGMSQADIKRAALSAAKERILRGGGPVDAYMLAKALAAVKGALG